jgi:hypothetical protein
MRPISSTILVLLTAVPALAQDKHTLRLKFVPGHVSHSLQSQDMSMEMAMGEQKMKTTMSVQMWTEAKIADVKDGTASIEHKYTRTKARSDGGMGSMKVDYDSDVPGAKAGPQFAAFGKLVGQKVTTRVDASSKVHGVDVPEDLDIDLERAGLNLKQEFERTFTAFPKDPIAVGESWTTETEMAMGQMGTMKGKVTNKLVDVKGDVATIEQKIEMDTASAKLPQGMKLDITKAEGTSKIDLRTGLPVESRMDMDMKMGDAMAMSVRSTTKQVEPPAAKPAPKADAPPTGK